MVHARRFYIPASTLVCALRNTVADRAAALAAQLQQQQADSSSADAGSSPPLPAKAAASPARGRRSPPPPCSAPELLQLLLCMDALGLLATSKQATQAPATAALHDVPSYELAAAVVEAHQQYRVPVPRGIRALLGWEGPKEHAQEPRSRRPRAAWLEELLRALVPQVQCQACPGMSRGWPPAAELPLVSR
jgi:hypothetical protein